jgi:hypothetical protein
MEHFLKCAWVATLVTAAICLAFAVGMLVPVVKGLLYWVSVIPLALLYSIGFKVGTLDGGFLVPNGYGYFVLAVAIWLISFGLTLIIRRE